MHIYGSLTQMTNVGKNKSVHLYLSLFCWRMSCRRCISRVCNISCVLLPGAIFDDQTSGKLHCRDIWCSSEYPRTRMSRGQKNRHRRCKGEKMINYWFLWSSTQMLPPDGDITHKMCWRGEMMCCCPLVAKGAFNLQKFYGFVDSSFFAGYQPTFLQYSKK